MGSPLPRPARPGRWAPRCRPQGRALRAHHHHPRIPLRDPVLWSWNLLAGGDLRVLPGVRIYLSPALTRYLNHSAYAVSWDERSNFSLRAGLSFDLK